MLKTAIAAAIATLPNAEPNIPDAEIHQTLGVTCIATGETTSLPDPLPPCEEPKEPVPMS